MESKNTNTPLQKRVSPKFRLLETKSLFNPMFECENSKTRTMSSFRGALDYYGSLHLIKSVLRVNSVVLLLYRGEIRWIKWVRSFHPVSTN